MIKIFCQSKKKNLKHRKSIFDYCFLFLYNYFLYFEWRRRRLFFSQCVPFVMTRIDPCVCISVYYPWKYKTEKRQKNDWKMFSKGARGWCHYARWLIRCVCRVISPCTVTIMWTQKIWNNGFSFTDKGWIAKRGGGGSTVLPSSLFGYYNIGWSSTYCEMEKNVLKGEKSVFSHRVTTYCCCWAISPDTCWNLWLNANWISERETVSYTVKKGGRKSKAVKTDDDSGNGTMNGSW